VNACEACHGEGSRNLTIPIVADVGFVLAGKWALVVVLGQLLATCLDMSARYVVDMGFFGPYFETLNVVLFCS